MLCKGGCCRGGAEGSRRTNEVCGSLCTGDAQGLRLEKRGRCEGSLGRRQGIDDWGLSTEKDACHLGMPLEVGIPVWASRT